MVLGLVALTQTIYTALPITYTLYGQYTEILNFTQKCDFDRIFLEIALRMLVDFRHAYLCDGNS